MSQATEQEKAFIRKQREDEYAETRRKQEWFRAMQKFPYETKLQHAVMRALQFYKTISGLIYR